MSSISVTEQVFKMKTRDIMNMIAQDVEVDVKLKKGMYGAGSADNRLPRTMDISRFNSMIPRKKEADPTPPPPPTTPAQ